MHQNYYFRVYHFPLRNCCLKWLVGWEDISQVTEITGEIVGFWRMVSFTAGRYNQVANKYNFKFGAHWSVYFWKCLLETKNKFSSLGKSHGKVLRRRKIGIKCYGKLYTASGIFVNFKVKYFFAKITWYFLYCLYFRVT